MRRVLPTAVAAAALCFSQLPAATATAPLGSVSDAASRAAAPQKIRTEFALSSAAYGTRVNGGALPANSQDTAYQRIGCTNVTGTEQKNYEADLTLPGLGKVEGVTTRVWTEKKGNVVSSYSQHSIARLIIGSSALGSLEIQGISSLSQAFNDNGRFGTKSTNEIARIVFKVAGQPARQLQIPAPGRTLTIPGIASISLGKSVKTVNPNGAQISSNVVDIQLPLTGGTRVRVAQTHAAIQGGIAQGLFQGYAAGIEARGLADNLKIGRTPLKLMPCPGTRGRVQTKDIAGVDLGDLGNLKTVAAGVKASNTARVATGTVAGRVADVSLLDGRVQIKGVIGVANVKRERGVVTRNSKGTTVVSIVIDGRSYTIPALGSLTIPGLLELDDAVETRTRNGLKVVGLRVTLLDGTGAVVDLGVAQLGIRPGVRPGS